MANELKATELPNNHIEFAQAVADAADRHSIDRFVLEYQPEFDIQNPSLTFWGKLKVIFSAKDRRGRPANNLKICYETNLEHVISATPESSN